MRCQSLKPTELLVQFSLLESAVDGVQPADPPRGENLRGWLPAVDFGRIVQNTGLEVADTLGRGAVSPHRRATVAAKVVSDVVAAECLGSVPLQIALAGDGQLVFWDYPVDGKRAA